MKASKRVNNYEVYPKAKVAQTIIYQGMSSHYRRIYNAKPRVDTGPPFSHRPKPNPLNKPTGWNKKQGEYNFARKCQSSFSLNSSKCSRKGCGDPPIYSFQPQISKTDTESTLRSLRVYHPPRRRTLYSVSSTTLQMKSDPESSVPEIHWIRTSEEEKVTPSKGSSSDSAYTEEGDGIWSGGESRGPTPVSDSKTVISSENLMYVKFVRGITEEVLRKGIFTNRALKNIFQSHIESHKKYLNLRRMQEEVEKLQMELGIPKEDSSDDTDYCSEYNSAFEDKESHPKIEDKELMDALSQLNISPSLKADIASSLGLYSTSTPYSSVSSSKNLKKSISDSSSNNTAFSTLETSGSSKRTTFSSPLEVVHNISHNKTEKFDHQQKFPQSDDDSYEMLSEGSESRPLTPLDLGCW